MDLSKVMAKVSKGEDTHVSSLKVMGVLTYFP
jgi:hypothetical protein